MNLNTLLRHDVFSVEQLSSTVSEAGTNFSSDKRLGQSFYNMIDYVADRIADESEIRRGKLFPYQYFAAYLNAYLEVPQNIRTAPHNAAEIACGNVPELPGTVVIVLDTSGSMSSAVTRHRGRGATSKSRCIDVAAPSCPDTALLNQSIFTGISLIHPTLFSATVMAKCVPENVEVVCPREICYKGFLAMAEAEYLEILDWLARDKVAGKRGSTLKSEPPVLERLGIEPTLWSAMVKNFGRVFMNVAGTAKSVSEARSLKTHRKLYRARV